MLFYAHIAAYHPSEFLARTQALLGASPSEPMDEQYALQIITNARIALRKYQLFSTACWAGLAGIILLGAGAITRLLT